MTTSTENLNDNETSESVIPTEVEEDESKQELHEELKGPEVEEAPQDDDDDVPQAEQMNQLIVEERPADLTTESSKDTETNVEAISTSSTGEVESPLSPVRNGSQASLYSLHEERIKVTLVLPLENRHTCPQCNDVLRYPMLFEECGHHVCSPCFYEFLRVEPRCPKDNTHINKDRAYVDKVLNKEIMLLGSKCGNSEWGCSWDGPLREAQIHMEKCEFVDVLCINDCGAKFQRRFQDKHVAKDCQKKIICCAFCDERFLREEKKAHLEDCMKVPLPCPNRCDKKLTISRDELDKHIEQDCPRTKIVCQFEEIGCPHKCSREKLAKHYKTGIIEHVRILYDLVMKEGKRLDQHQEFLQEHGTLLEVHQGQISDLEKIARNQLIWRIDEYSRKMKEAKSGNTTTLFSPPFNTSKHGYRLCASMCLNGDGKGKGTHISAFVSILKGAYDNLLKWPFSFRVTFYLLDQNSDPCLRKHIKFSIKPNPCPDNEPFLGQPKMEKNASFGGAKFAKHEDCESRTYVKDDTIFLKIAIDCDGSAEV